MFTKRRSKLKCTKKIANNLGLAGRETWVCCIKRTKVFLKKIVFFFFFQESRSQSWRGKKADFLFNSQIINSKVRTRFQRNLSFAGGFWNKRIFWGGVWHVLCLLRSALRSIPEKGKRKKQEWVEKSQA